MCVNRPGVTSAAPASRARPRRHERGPGVTRARAHSWHSATPTCDTFARSVAGVSEDARHRLGRRGEDLAAEHLKRRGFQIVERNYRTRWGELDIVAFDGHTIAFCEVKSRRLGARALPLFASLHQRKRAQVRRMALQWLCERGERQFAPVLRFDAIGVTFDQAGELLALEHLEGAF